MSNLTPAQAFGHIKALWPETVRIGKELNYVWRAFNLAGIPTAAGSTGIHLDWGNSTQYPETVYRDATPQDAVDGAIAEFSGYSDFRDSVRGTIGGWCPKPGANDEPKAFIWYRLESIRYKDSYPSGFGYCRIPVPASADPPQGYREIQEEDKSTYDAYGHEYSDIFDTNGNFHSRCFWATDPSTNSKKWREVGIGWVENPRFIRKHLPADNPYLQGRTPR